MSGTIKRASKKPTPSARMTRGGGQRRGAARSPRRASVGAEILDKLDDTLLKQNADVLIWLTRHWLADLRENVRPTVRRLAASGSVSWGTFRATGRSSFRS